MMKRALTILAVAIGLPLAAASSAGESAVLQRLADQLRHVRSLPPGTDTSLHCPDGLGELIGVTKSTVISQLAEPDYQEPLDGEDGSLRYAVSYFLTAPASGPSGADGTAVVNHGGGFPIVTLTFGPDDVVRGAECSYSR